MLNDDPGTPRAGEWEINTGWVFTQQRDFSRQIDQPQLDLNYGVFDNFYVKYETGWLNVREPGQRSKSGWDDSIFGFKWRFHDGGKEGVAISTYPKLQVNSLPSSQRRGIVERNSSIQLPFEFQKSFGPIQADIEIGRTFHTRQASLADNWNVGAIVGREFNSRLEAMAEVFSTLSPRFSQTGVLVNVGARYKVDEHTALIFSVGHGVGGALQPRWIGYLGFQLSL